MGLLGALIDAACWQAGRHAAAVKEWFVCFYIYRRLRVGHAPEGDRRDRHGAGGLSGTNPPA